MSLLGAIAMPEETGKSVVTDLEQGHFRAMCVGLVAPLIDPYGERAVDTSSPEWYDGERCDISEYKIKMVNAAGDIVQVDAQDAFGGGFMAGGKLGSAGLAGVAGAGKFVGVGVGASGSAAYQTPSDLHQVEVVTPERRIVADWLVGTLVDTIGPELDPATAQMKLSWDAKRYGDCLRFTLVHPYESTVPLFSCALALVSTQADPFTAVSRAAVILHHFMVQAGRSHGAVEEFLTRLFEQSGLGKVIDFPNP